MVKDGLAEKASTLGSGVTKLPFNFFHIIYVRQDSQLSPKGSSVGKRLREYLRMELAAVPGSVKGKGVVRIGKGFGCSFSAIGRICCLMFLLFHWQVCDLGSQGKGPGQGCSDLLTSSLLWVQGPERATSQGEILFPSLSMGRSGWRGEVGEDTLSPPPHPPQKKEKKIGHD